MIIFFNQNFSFKNPKMKPIMCPEKERVLSESESNQKGRLSQYQLQQICKRQHVQPSQQCLRGLNNSTVPPMRCSKRHLFSETWLKMILYFLFKISPILVKLYSSQPKLNKRYFTIYMIFSANCWWCRTVLHK